MYYLIRVGISIRIKLVLAEVLAGISVVLVLVLAGISRY